MKKIYKRIQVNKELLKLNAESNELSLDDFLSNEVNETLPAGKVIGVYFISYKNASESPINEEYIGESMRSAPINFSYTEITIKDSRGHQLTEPTELRDYKHKDGGYISGFKLLNFESKNEKITISWETINAIPICGEFVFAIEVSNCNC